jgi:hypothetical protein
LHLLFRQHLTMADNSCMDPQGFNENSGLRASDADRDTAASVINDAMAEGRLTAEEHADRLDLIYAARTHGDLVPLLADLPAAGTARAPAAGQPAQLAPGGPAGRIVAIFGGASRKGGWQAEPVINVVAVFGGVELDFREAVLPGKEVILRVTAVLGGVDVTVPPEMRVIDSGGVAILGGKDIAGPGPESSGPDAPVLRIEGTCILGGIDVKRKARKRNRDRGRAASIESGGSGPLGLDDVLSQVRQQRRQIHSDIRDRRHELHHQMRERRRDIRRGWTDSDDE